VAKDLVDRQNARAVVIIANPVIVKVVIDASRSFVPPGTFTWIASDVWAERVEDLREFGEYMWDTLTFNPSRYYSEEFIQFFDTITPVS
jgi:hypothetical protein